MTDAHTSLRPRLAFRVGVTGHLRVPEDDKRVVAAVDHVLKLVHDELGELSKAAEVRRAYAAPAAGERPFLLRIVSPLAAGADRIVARAGLRLGPDVELYAPLPFPVAEYREDFDDHGAASQPLLDKAQVFELDGERDRGIGGEDAKTTRDEGYETVGRFVVRNCDLLIAIWDGERERGPGGAAAIAAYAARAGVRVWWIHAVADEPARLIRGAAEFRNPRRAPEGAEAAAKLREYIAREVLPPRYDPPDREGLFGALGQFWQNLRAPDDSPLEEFFREAPLPRRPLWRTYEVFMAVINAQRLEDVGLAFRARPPEPPAAAKPDASAWRTLYEAADGASLQYGDRYRSCYVLVALLAIFALASAAFSGEGKGVSAWTFILIELVAMAAISLLVVVNYGWRWHERWIAYRLLAEIARKQRVLALVGQTLPGSDVQLLTSFPDRKDADLNERPPREAWVAWLFMAHRRASPPPTTGIAKLKREALQAGKDMIEQQIEYHRGRRDRSRLAGARVRLVSEGFFIGALGVALFKLWLISQGQIEMIHEVVFIAAAISSVATAFVGIRAYAEFTLLVRQSTHMILALEAARQELDAQEEGIEGPQASLQLGRTLFAATTAMMQDITGWAHLFRVKTLEAA